MQLITGHSSDSQSQVNDLLHRVGTPYAVEVYAVSRTHLPSDRSGISMAVTDARRELMFAKGRIERLLGGTEDEGAEHLLGKSGFPQRFQVYHGPQGIGIVRIEYDLLAEDEEGQRLFDEDRIEQLFYAHDCREPITSFDDVTVTAAYIPKFYVPKSAEVRLREAA